MSSRPTDGTEHAGNHKHARGLEMQVPRPRALPRPDQRGGTDDEQAQPDRLPRRHVCQIDEHRQREDAAARAGQPE